MLGEMAAFAQSVKALSDILKGLQSMSETVGASAPDQFADAVNTQLVEANRANPDDWHSLRCPACQTEIAYPQEGLSEQLHPPIPDPCDDDTASLNLRHSWPNCASTSFNMKNNVYQLVSPNAARMLLRGPALEYRLKPA